jgi:hypothetical protein
MPRPSSLANAVTISALPRRGEKNALSRDRKETAERACGSSLLQSVAECGDTKRVLICNGDLATHASSVAQPSIGSAATSAQARVPSPRLSARDAQREMNEARRCRASPFAKRTQLQTCTR